MLPHPEQDNPWTTVWEEHHKAPYMYKQTKWVSYDNEESIRTKVRFAYDHDLAGVMTWSIDTDDLRRVTLDNNESRLVSIDSNERDVWKSIIKNCEL